MNSARKWGLALVVVGTVAVLAALLPISPTDEPESLTHPPSQESAEGGTSQPRLRGSSDNLERDGLKPPLPPRTSPLLVELRGRVLDPEHREVVGALVEIRSPDRAPVTCTTGQDGRFTAQFGRWPASRALASVRAVHPGGMAATLAVEVHPNSPRILDIGALRLRMTVGFVVRVRRTGRPVPRATVYCASIGLRHAHRVSGHRLRWGWSQVGVSDGNGELHFSGVPVGAVRLLAVADGPLRGDREFRTDELASAVEVVLSEARDIQVEVVREDDGTPVAGCEVVTISPAPLTREPWSHPLTNARGLAALTHVPLEISLRIAVVGEGVRASALIAPGQDRARVELPQPKELRFATRFEAGAVPDDGSSVELVNDSWSWWPGAPSALMPDASIRDGDLVVTTRGKFDDRVLARLLDGRTGVVAVDTSLSSADLEPVVFRDPRELLVRVVERGTQRPTRGVAVRVFMPDGDVRLAPVTTDASGLAHIEGLPESRGTVGLCLNPEWVEQNRQGIFSRRDAFDIENQETHLVFEVEPRIPALVDVWCAGIRGLPRGLEVQVRQLYEGLRWHRIRDLEYDPAQGQLRFSARPLGAESHDPVRAEEARPRIRLRLTSDSHSTEYVDLRLDRSAGALVGSADLLPAASLVVRVSAPRGAFHSIRLERLDAGDVWSPVVDGPLVPLDGPSGVDRYEGLRPGQYRLREERLGWLSETVYAASGGAPVTLEWDLTRVGWAEGVVELPPGVSSQGLDLHVVEVGESPRLLGVARELTGTQFRVQVPGDRRVRLQPLHPLCRPDPDEGAVELERPGGRIRLRMLLRE